ncbi:hypothetical protein AAHA92_12462 [Salvia divinorum]|uniref:Uncharacterized protein n=1 Tax=Salvia divinorum TaxID=28513 RepID=A0ABD1HLC1_SALDI
MNFLWDNSGRLWSAFERDLRILYEISLPPAFDFLFIDFVRALHFPVSLQHLGTISARVCFCCKRFLYSLGLWVQ